MTDEIKKDSISKLQEFYAPAVHWEWKGSRSKSASTISLVSHRIQEEYDLFFFNRNKITLCDLLSGKGDRLGKIINGIEISHKEKDAMDAIVVSLAPLKGANILSGVLIASVFGCPKTIKYMHLRALQEDKNFLQGLDTIYWCLGDTDLASDMLGNTSLLMDFPSESFNTRHNKVLRTLYWKDCEDFVVPDRDSAERIIVNALCTPRLDRVNRCDQSFLSEKAERYFLKAIENLDG
jgi:hypothetical protein